MGYCGCRIGKIHAALGLNTMMGEFVSRQPNVLPEPYPATSLAAGQLQASYRFHKLGQKTPTPRAIFLTSGNEIPTTE